MKKAIALNKRQFARMVANLDGKFAGVTQAEVEKALTLALLLDTAARVLKYKSPLTMLNKKSIKKAKAFVAKAKAKKK